MKSKSRTTHKAFDEQGRRSQSCWRPCRSRCPLSSWSKSQKRGSKGERRLCMPVTCCLSWGSLLARGGFFKTADNELENLCCCLCCLLFLPQTKRDLQCLFIFLKKKKTSNDTDMCSNEYIPNWIFLLQLEASDFLYDSKLWLTHSKTASKYFAFDIRIFLYQTLKKISWSSILQSLENKAWYFVICYDSIGLSGDMKISLTYCKQLKHYHSILLVKMIISNSTFTYA